MIVLAFPYRVDASFFLRLPFGEEYDPYISCGWTCLRENRTVYNHRATDYGRVVERDARGRIIAYNTIVRAAAPGVVVHVKDGLDPGELIDVFEYGNHVRIRHENGYETRYAHLLKNTITAVGITVGERVDAGTELGFADHTGVSSGPHLHFEVRDPNGKRVNPYGDPPDYAGGCGPNALWATCPPTPASPTTTDADGDGFTTAQGDCDDRNRDINPGPNTEERCDGKDNDCNGSTDEPWHTGLAQDIGNPCTVGTGACARTGRWQCAPDGRATVCDATPGTPSTESCNGLDDDCDEITDNPWHAGLAQDVGNTCTVGIGDCVNTGNWECAPDGRATICSVDPFPPHPESCNRRDDDCDGSVDENWLVGLSTDLGEACALDWSTATCTGATTIGVWECAPDGLAVVCDAPIPEYCNWVDDDCNGFVDDIPREYLQYDSANCGVCQRRCLPTQRCVDWECTD